jgi:hypothetical protein
LRADWFQQIESETVPVPGIDVEHADPRIETEGSGGQPSLGFEQRIEIVENSVWRIGCKPG